MERWRNIKLLKGGKLHLNIDMLKEIKRKDQWVIIREINKSLHGKNSNEKMKNKSICSKCDSKSFNIFNNLIWKLELIQVVYIQADSGYE